MKKYFLPYNENEKANYIYVLMFYSIAKFNINSKRYDLITYTSITNLTDQLNSITKDNTKSKISDSTIRRVLKRKCYNTFLDIDTKSKTIRLRNDIRQCNKFVMLSESEALKLINQKNDFLAKYYLYLKYYCGYSKSKTIDTTAKQFLAACGYSTDANNNISRVSECNSILTKIGLITITKFKDFNGYERNCYRCS